MKTTIKVWHLIVIILIVVASYSALLSIVRGKYHSEVDRLNIELYEAKMKLNSYDIKVDSLTEKVSESELIIISKQKALKNLEKEYERIKQLRIRDVELIGKLELDIKVLKEKVAPVDTVVIVKDCDDKKGSFIKLPLEYRYSDRWASIYTGIDTIGLADQSFKIKQLPLNLVIGTKGYFSNKTQVASVTTESPYVNIDDVRFIKVEDKRKSPANYTIKGIVAGLAAGFLLFYF